MKKKTVKVVPFSRLSAAGKRVAIAKDVLAQIKKHQFLISRGEWCEFGELPVIEAKPVFNQSFLLKGKKIEIAVPKCNVCALGAAMCSSVRLGNVAELEKSSSETDVQDQLSRYFSGKQMEMIEACFERRINEGDELCDFGSGEEMTPSEEKSIEKFAGKYDGDKSRAVAIFKNIIKNNGQFKP